MSRLWENKDRAAAVDGSAPADDLDLRDVGERASSTVRSADSCVVLTVVIDTRSGEVRRVAVAGVCGCRCSELVAGQSPPASE
ncbi:MAG TPA: hypothetical protein VFV00_11450 [Acidimicrobiales bacterium]|nr:hypothetical protein [Acidimicrobiales bacterium]